MWKRLISARVSGMILLIAMTAMLVVHVLIAAGVMPSDFIWGGRIGSETELLVMEGIAIAATLLFMGLIALKTGLAGRAKFRRTAAVGAWIVFAYFLLNTAGNLASEAALERTLFVPVTIVLTLLALRVAMEESA
ncbi:hypothetical protein [Cohnella caldifontis]|uniref:hypothetical protein n=1 Tax=Cohnella caldifontis TaxID=3027471 RepID=UPI0023EE0B85|nr:hypothetical protein [Cohnella sp. YIM B05605]